MGVSSPAAGIIFGPLFAGIKNWKEGILREVI